MKTFTGLLCALVIMTLPAQGAAINLFDWGFNIDGTTWCGAGPCDNDSTNQPWSLPPAINVGAFDFTTGLGTVEVTIGGAGAHYVDFFVDHEIDELVNTFFNEFGATTGAADAGQSWEIDEPGFVFGDIFSNLLGSTLDNGNGVPAGSEDDVSMAMGWDFSLLDGETAVMQFLISENAPISGFYLTQTDPDSGASIYFSSSLNVGGTVIPEPSQFLPGIGLLGLLYYRIRKGKKRAA